MARRASAGFTLIELLAGAAVSLTVAAAAALLLAQVAAQLGRQRQRAALRAQAALALEVLATDLRHAGLGRPTGARADGAHELFPPALLDAQPGALSLLADLPRPDSNFNGLSALSDSQALLPADGLALLNELNQACDPWVAGTPCATNTASLLFGPATASCGADPGAPSCPWGLGRYRPGEYLVVANGAGGWAQARVASDLHAAGALRYLHLGGPLPPGLLAAAPGGFASTPDRVHYRLDGDRLERAQCWGDLGAPLTPAGLAAPCGTGDDGTGWEPLATGVTAFELTYFDRSGGPLTPPLLGAALRRVTRVGIRLALARGAGGEAVGDDERIDVALRAGGPP